MASSPAHGLGMIAKFGVGILIWGFSIGLSLAFFFEIAPPDNPAFPYMGIGLTEGGFVLWMVVFLCTNHDNFNKVIAMLMAIASAATSLILAGTQFYSMLASHFNLASIRWLYSTVSIALMVMFGLNCSVVLIELIAWYFNIPGHEFFGTKQRNLIPAQRNLIPARMYFTEEEWEQLRQSVTGKITAIQPEESESAAADPLALRQLPQQQSQQQDYLIQAGRKVKEGASTLMSKVSSSTRHGKKGGLAPGKTNEITNGTGLPNGGNDEEGGI